MMFTLKIITYKSWIKRFKLKFYRGEVYRTWTFEIVSAGTSERSRAGTGTVFQLNNLRDNVFNRLTKSNCQQLNIFFDVFIYGWSFLILQGA